jgi:hypothetical protein
MMHRLSVLFLAFAAVALPAFSQQSKTPQQQNPAQPEAPPVLSVPAGYHYEPRGRRDPFVNPIPKPLEEEKPAPVVRPPGLKGVLVADAKLLGVVTGKDPMMTKAVIQAPGNKTYFAANGDSLFDAVIKEIQPDAVIFTLITPVGAPNGSRPQRREIVRKVRTTTGEGK